VADTLAIVRDEVARLDTALPVYAVRRMDEVVQASPGMATRRALVVCFSVFALLAIAVAAVGIAAVVGHELARQRTANALRLALGATPSSIRSISLRSAGRLLAAGIAAGIVITALTMPSVLAWLNEADPAELSALIAAGSVIGVVGLAAIVPALRQATRVDLMRILRDVA
jgi:ABC-type antimicrobial peptide transport system permease subunit